MSVAIRFEDISKRYRLGEVGSGMLTTDLHRAWAMLRGRPDPLARIGVQTERRGAGNETPLTSANSDSHAQTSHSKSSSKNDYIWALRDINFDVQRGELLGIIGRNGAGKSTLLKLLSRVTAPTTGVIKAKGRIASLLEVGTGFHPELTGRENIFLNGAILGMRRHEVVDELESIVDFSGCGQFLDTPVKRYSSGMMVRLGFAIAAHLRCEILVVDEVLAVGDAEFQRKCIGKMHDVANSGRTILFVSHNLSVVQSLCKKCVVVRDGTIACHADTRTAITRYLADASIPQRYADTSSRTDRSGNGLARLVSISCMSVDASDDIDADASITSVSGVRFRVTFQTHVRELRGVNVGLGIYDDMQQKLAFLSTEQDPNFQSNPGSCVTLECVTAPLHITAGVCHVNVALYTGTAESGELLDYLDNAIKFTIAPADFFGNGVMPSRQLTPYLIRSSWSKEG